MENFTRPDGSWTGSKVDVLAVVLAGGIYIGSKLQFNNSSDYVFKSEPNKLDFVLDLIESDYVDTVSKNDLIEKTIPMLLQQLDPHSVYIPAKDLQVV